MRTLPKRTQVSVGPGLNAHEVRVSRIYITKFPEEETCRLA